MEYSENLKSGYIKEWNKMLAFQNSHEEKMFSILNIKMFCSYGDIRFYVFLLSPETKR